MSDTDEAPAQQDRRMYWLVARGLLAGAALLVGMVLMMKFGLMNFGRLSAAGPLLCVVVVWKLSGLVPGQGRPVGR